MEAAFPFRTSSTFYKNGDAVSSIVEENHPGMTLRDWFAGQALNGLLSEKGDEPHTAISYKEWSRHAYDLADAMIAERSRISQPTPGSHV